MVAYTDAAGKYNPDAARNGNEDSFYVDDDLGDEVPNHCTKDAVRTLSDCGLLMVVADGMGGMNAGEVASQIAIETVEEYFSPGKIVPDMAATHEKRKEYLESVIVEADKRIKVDARRNPEHDGMGSTIILAWMMGQEISVSWCGDSRAYRFNPQTGIEPLSEDHSYVQDLVREGKITYEATFGHPNGNIVTRSLGDPGKTAEPESRCFKVYNHDIIFLCSDGLSGVLRDKKTKKQNGEYYPGENMEDIIRANCATLEECREALWAAAERADWYDNVTLVMCEVMDGAAESDPGMRQVIESDSQEDSIKKSFWIRTVHIKTNRMKLTVGLLVLLLLLIGSGFGFYRYGKGKNDFSRDVHDTLPSDTADGLGGGDFPPDTILGVPVAKPKDTKVPRRGLSETSAKQDSLKSVDNKTNEEGKEVNNLTPIPTEKERDGVQERKALDDTASIYVGVSNEPVLEREQNAPQKMEEK